VLVGKERFSEDHPWSEMPEHWPAGLAGRAVIEVAGQGQLEARLADGGPPVDLDTAADEGVWVANMAGLNAVPVAEHAVALLLALARRLPEAQKGFEPGRWGEPAGRSLAGTAACVAGAGAIGTQIARRLAAFGVTVTGVRRHPPDGPVPPFAALYPDRALPGRRATRHPPAHRGDRAHRFPDQRLLRSRKPATGRRPRPLP
jgi:hypothetical protein